MGAEAEEVGRLEVHTLPEADEVYEGTLRRLLAEKRKDREGGDDDDVVDDFAAGGTPAESEGQKLSLIHI